MSSKNSTSSSFKLITNLGYSKWIPKVTTCSAYEKTGIDAIWEIISEYFELVKSNHYFEEKRQNQNQFWMMETINEQLKSHFYNIRIS